MEKGRDHCLVISPEGRGRERGVANRKRTVLLHNRQELDDDLGARPDQDLALARLLGIVDRVEAVVENARLDHDCGIVRFSNGSMLI